MIKEINKNTWIFNNEARISDDENIQCKDNESKHYIVIVEL